MKKIVIITSIIFLAFSYGYAQTKQPIWRTTQIADSLFKAKNYSNAITNYLLIEQQLDFPLGKYSALYKVACCLSLDNKKDSAFIVLRKVIKLGFTDKQKLINENDFTNLHSSIEWQKTLNLIKENVKTKNLNPAKVKIITSDIHNFWKAYEKANKDTLHYKQLFKQFYFDKASIGMNDYMGKKVKIIDYFISHIKSKPKYYNSIKGKTLQVDSYKSDFIKSFKNLKDIYPNAQFPNIYFVMGAFTSGGTVTDAGLLIGVNQYCVDDDVNIDEISANEKMVVGKFKYLKFVVPHELIHFQQDSLKSDTTTLSYAIAEGMADFIGELISGIKAAPELHSWASGKEKAIWERFKIDMYEDRYSNWIANGSSSTLDNPQDQGYWVGYQICKSYYDNSVDKKQAIYDMLNIKDYKDFLQKSKWEEKLAGQK
jgi:hypothetical protein